eukprot:12051150-Karenia_brevis.AAC.1
MGTAYTGPSCDYIAFEQGESLQQLVQDIAGSEYGDNLSLQIASQILERPIFIWHRDSDQRPYVVTHPGIPEANLRRPLCLLRTEEAPPHYDALVVAAAMGVDADVEADVANEGESNTDSEPGAKRQ